MLYSVPAAIVLGIAGICIVFLTAMLRYFTRAFIVRAFGLDDWLSVVALCLKIAATAVFLDGFMNHGFGYHVMEVERDRHRLEGAFKDLWIFNLMYTLGTGIIKISFAVTLLRILQSPLQRIIAWTVIVVNTIAVIAMATMIIVICMPPKYFWEQAVDPWYLAKAAGKDPDALGLKRQGSCKTYGPQLNYTTTAVSVVTDLTLAIILPVLMVWNLNMQTGMKVTTCLLFAFGTLACVASVNRLAYAYTFSNVDILFYGRPFIIWTEIEFSLCLIGTSTALLKPLFTGVVPHKDPTDKRPSVGDEECSCRSDSLARLFRSRRCAARNAVAGAQAKPQQERNESRYVVVYK